jgi:SNF2 family DNA or RNA helicase
MKWEPHQYQLNAIKFMVERATAGLLLDPGLGKTAITLSAFKLLQAKDIGIDAMLVIAPLRPSYLTWPKEAQKWDHLKHLKVVVLHGPKKAELIREKADVYVINPEGLPWLVRNVPRKSPRSPWPWQMLVVDESTRFKHARTQRFLTLKPMLNEFARRYILTGSPAPNGLLDLFGQVYILDQGASLGRFVSHYKMLFFDPSGYMGYQSTPKPGAEQKIYQRLKPLVLRMAAEDYLDLPPLIENVVEVELPDDAMEEYKHMEKALIAEVGKEVIMAANASAAWGKCRQIANGGIYHEDGEKFTHIHDAKVDAVEEIIEELQGKPALVAYEYKHDLDRLRERLGRDTPYIGGGVPASRFREIEAAWNRGDLPVLLAQPQSVAHGLNLQGTGAAVVFAGLTPNLEVDEQFIRRVWRQGQRERVIVHRIVAQDTVDEAIIGMLCSKNRTQKALLLALKDHLKRRAA